MSKKNVIRQSSAAERRNEMVRTINYTLNHRTEMAYKKKDKSYFVRYVESSVYDIRLQPTYGSVFYRPCDFTAIADRFGFEWYFEVDNNLRDESAPVLHIIVNL